MYRALRRPLLGVVLGAIRVALYWYCLTTRPPKWQRKMRRAKWIAVWLFNAIQLGLFFNSAQDMLNYMLRDAVQEANCGPVNDPALFEAFIPYAHLYA